MAKTIKVILYGLGPIGAACARVLATRPDYEFVGAVDLDPNKVGQDIADVIGLPEKTGVKVSDKAPNKKRATVDHCINSSTLHLHNLHAEA